MSNEKEIFVIGHKNPDTDSVCSAICYARLKEKITGQHYVAKRAGHLNEETQYVMDKLGVQPPEYMKDVRPQVRDIQIRKTPGVSKEISVKTAWTLMKEQNVVTLPVTKENVLEGLITIGDIAKSYFQVYDSTILATAQTRYQNIVDTLEGTVVAGEADGIFKEGKVVIAAANPDMMENYIGTGDIVILGNRYEAQLCAIEMEAGCLIICEGAQVSKTITKVAKEHNCLLITTKFDTYTVARLINQSMPIRFLMKEKEGIVKFQTEDFIEDIQTVMAKLRHRDFPVEDTQGNYVGMISRRNLLGAGKKKLILVDHNERGQAVNGVETAEILEIIDHHRLGAIQTVSPVFFRNQPLGSTATIIYHMYQENQAEIDKNVKTANRTGKTDVRIAPEILNRMMSNPEVATKYENMLSKIPALDRWADSMIKSMTGSEVKYRQIWIDKDGNMGSMVITGPSEEQKRAYEDRKIEKKKENEQKLVERRAERKEQMKKIQEDRRTIFAIGTDMKSITENVVAQAVGTAPSIGGSCDVKA